MYAWHGKNRRRGGPHPRSRETRNPFINSSYRVFTSRNETEDINPYAGDKYLGIYDTMLRRNKIEEWEIHYHLNVMP